MQFKPISLRSTAAAQIRQSLQQDILNENAIAENRRCWEEGSAAIDTPAGIRTESVMVANVECLLLTPDTRTRDLILYIHGGGLVEGSAETSRVWCARIAMMTGVPVLSVDYKLAPEHPYPAAQNEIINVLKSLGSDDRVDRVISIGADSSGALLAIQALIEQVSNKKTLPLTAFLISPSIDITFSGDSMIENATRDPFVSRAVLEHYASLYIGTSQQSRFALSPLFANLSGLPPLLIHADADEILVDDSRRLAASIKKHGGSVDLVVSQGLWHTWPCWGEFPESNDALLQITGHIHSHAPHKSNVND